MDAAVVVEEAVEAVVEAASSRSTMDQGVKVEFRLSPSVAAAEEVVEEVGSAAVAYKDHFSNRVPS